MAVRLDAFLAERMRRPFVWLENDCITFASDWVLAKTGRDPMADMRGRSFKDSLRQLQREGGFAAAADARLGNRINPLSAQDGDVMLLCAGRRQRASSGYTFGICAGPYIVAPGLRGLKFVPITLAEAAWHV